MEVLGFPMLLYSNRIVITGGTGRFASSLKKVKSKYSVFFPSKSNLNILKENSILKYLKNKKDNKKNSSSNNNFICTG